jgi:hypothetical protein
LRSIPRAIAGLALAGSLFVLPAAQITRAAPATAGPRGTHQGTPPISLTYVASVEGVTPQVLQQDLQAGQTLLQIAQAAHSKYASSAQVLATALLAQVKSQLDQAASSGRISQAQASQRYNALLSSVTKLVTTPHPQLRGAFRTGAGTQGRFGSPGQGTRGYGMLARGPILTTLATACHTTSSALQTAIRTGGKTILAICQSTNSSITESDLVTAITNSYKTRLDASVKAGRISASQESQLLANLKTRIETSITTPLPTGTTPTA